MLEAEESVGHEFNDEDGPLIAVREMVGLGAHAGDHDRARRLLRADEPEEPRRGAALYRVRMPRGSIEPGDRRVGDAFLAGFVAQPLRGAPRADCLAYGVACGAESTQHLGAGLVDPEQVGRLRSRDRGRAPALPAEAG